MKRYDTQLQIRIDKSTLELIEQAQALHGHYNLSETVRAAIVDYAKPPYARVSNK